MEWCRAIEVVALKDPSVPDAHKEWGGLSVGFVVGKGEELKRDFCILVRPHASELRAEELRICEDEDDLEIEEPDYLFRVPFAICKQVLRGKLDPFQALRAGQVRVEGDMTRLLAMASKYQPVGVRIVEQIETTFP